MLTVRKALYYLQNPGKMIIPLADRGLFNWLPDEPYLKLVYRGQMGKKLDLKHPQTFSEKLQWLKLYNRDPLFHNLVDKHEVKQYVANRIGAKYIIPTLGVWNDVKSIPFNQLPNQFVLKCTHDGASVVICRNRQAFDIEAAKAKLSHHMNKSAYWYGREWVYKDIIPRIIAEPYLEDHKTRELRDYKFFCFNGQPKCFKIDYDRFTNHHANYYYTNGSLAHISETLCPADPTKQVEMPTHLETMIRFAEKLSCGIPFLRTDFYEVNGNVYFGELTFYPSSGLRPFEYKGNDELLGSWIQLPTGGAK